MKKILQADGTFRIQLSPSGRKYLECKLEGYCIISDEEYKEYKQLKKNICN